MSDLDNFYTTVLYPFQDGILTILKKLSTPFFLTGGTALARGYLNHRYSDDLDFFVNDDPHFRDYVRIIEESLMSESLGNAWRLDQEGIIRSERFISFSLVQDEIVLKMDFVNDIAYRVGVPFEHPVLGTIDTIENILTNKIGALYRYAEKDVADIWAIWKKYPIDWQEVFTQATRKDAGIDEVSAAEIIDSFPEQRFDVIRWSGTVDKREFFEDLKRISYEILKI